MEKLGFVKGCRGRECVVRSGQEVRVIFLGARVKGCVGWGCGGWGVVVRMVDGVRNLLECPEIFGCPKFF